jgi:uncharacterized protein (TIGR03000 family)
MYSLVLATMLTTGAATPDWRFGCCGGCCGGCYGCCGGCWGCCGGCYGCCGGCYGCWGGCYGGCYGCYGCYGCCGGVVAPGAVAPVGPKLPAAPKKEEKKTAYLGNAAAVLLKAPAGVRLSVEGLAIPRTAIEETFRTPDLEPGYAYTYTFKAEAVVEGRPVAFTKSVRVQSGQTSEADFTKLTTEGKDVAKVTVKLPADARLYVDNVVCPLSSDTRTFNTPDLEVGRTYYYTLKAEVVRDGVARARSTRVLVEAGKDVTVEFKDLPVQSVSR